MKKLKPINVNTICWIGLSIGFIVAFAGFLLGKIVLIVGLIVMFCSIIFRVIFYRCPHCEMYLDRSTGDYCPYCGEDVNK